MNNKWILSVVLVVVAVMVGGLLMMNGNKPDNTQPNNNQNPGEVFDPQKPNFITGQLTKVEEGKIEFQSGPDLLTAELSSSTKLVKQVKDSKGVITNADAVLSDFKAKQIIVVYFSVEPTNKVYKADKVQIISQ